tara:strand:+ start:5454 stop:6197 length:744 start_codon:yes stop_codon:yes gene_type:complete
MSYQIFDNNDIPSVEPEKIYQAILNIIEDTQYGGIDYEEAWDMFGAMAWESFADVDGIGNESQNKVAFNPIAHTYDDDGLLAVGVFQVSVNHFPDMIMRSMIDLGYTDEFNFSPTFLSVKKNNWKADDPDLEIKERNFNVARLWLKNPDNEFAILQWAKDPNTFDVQATIAKEAFMDREKQGVYGGEAWDAYKYGEVDKGHNILNRDYGYQKFDQVNLHALATDTLHIDNTNEEEQYSILDGIYNKF